MIAWLQGELLAKQAPTILLNVNGVGYELEAPLSVFYELPAKGEAVSLHVHMVVRVVLSQNSNVICFEV